MLIPQCIALSLSRSRDLCEFFLLAIQQLVKIPSRFISEFIPLGLGGSDQGRKLRLVRGQACLQRLDAQTMLPFQRRALLFIRCRKGRAFLIVLLPQRQQALVAGGR